jgi:hypothetical protein
MPLTDIELQLSSLHTDDDDDRGIMINPEDETDVNLSKDKDSMYIELLEPK